MTNNFDNNDSSIFAGKLRQQDVNASQKLNELKGKIEELARQEEVRKTELENEAIDQIDDILSQVELRAAEDEDCFTSGIDSLLDELCKFLSTFFTEFEVDADPKTYWMIKERKEKSWLAVIMKFIKDKVQELIRKIFSRDLSFDEKLTKEIKGLEEKLFGGGLSKEGEIAILERLEALKNLKLKIQMFLVGWVITSLAALFEVDLVTAVETGTSKEEDKKAEKTSSKEKEATKEAREDVEIKIDAKEKPQLIVPISLFDFSSGFAKPIPLAQREFNILRGPIKKIVELPPKEVMSNKDSEGLKTQNVKGTNEGRNKQAEPKEEVCLAAQGQALPKQGSGKRIGKFQTGSRVSRRENLDNSTKYEPMQGSVNNAQENPRSKVTDAFEERVEGQSVGKTLS
ncbi:hypothetical protein [Candidatus Wolbachia massiliensis]|uniref:Uncharacterized protein n=1 Tax=Candidatus Wolbachia massiliensis TaxID=1845000 RepID=A0A7L7YQQ9_9RICK|nr:hypothetical protein [Candidatus Wolbachia massiliensis]QOD38349.1 hypothetical protein ID128_00195 [Candidatus Wolbachia massiliensis]